MKIYAYRMTSDTGYAPCVFESGYKPSEKLTLACCKGGQLRSKKKNGECTGEKTPVNAGMRFTIGNNHYNRLNSDEQVYVIGILKDKIIWCAQITEIKMITEYFSNEDSYGSRLDFIYKVNPNSLPSDKIGKLVRNEKHSLFHGKDMKEQHQRDELGKYVLISDNFVYFGKSGKEVDKKLLDRLPKRQETKCYDSSDEDLCALVNYLLSQGIHSKDPTERLVEKIVGGVNPNESYIIPQRL